jgi:hypothetical protein
MARDEAYTQAEKKIEAALFLKGEFLVSKVKYR